MYLLVCMYTTSMQVTSRAEEGARSPKLDLQVPVSLLVNVT